MPPSATAAVNGTVACSHAVDLVLIIDESTSVNSNQFAALCGFLAEGIVPALSLDAGRGVVLGAIGFAGQATTHFRLGDVRNAATAAAVLGSLQRIYGPTRTDLGIAAAAAEFAARARPSATRVAVLFVTRGSDNTANTIQSAELARAAGVAIVAVVVSFDPAQGDSGRALIELLAETGGVPAQQVNAGDWGAIVRNASLGRAVARAACTATNSTWVPSSTLSASASATPTGSASAWAAASEPPPSTPTASYVPFEPSDTPPEGTPPIVTAGAVAVGAAFACTSLVLCARRRGTQFSAAGDDAHTAKGGGGGAASDNSWPSLRFWPNDAGDDVTAGDPEGAAYTLMEER